MGHHHDRRSRLADNAPAAFHAWKQQPAPQGAPGRGAEGGGHGDTRGRGRSGTPDPLQTSAPTAFGSFRPFPGHPSQPARTPRPGQAPAGGRPTTPQGRRAGARLPHPGPPHRQPCSPSIGDHGPTRSADTARARNRPAWTGAIRRTPANPSGPGPGSAHARHGCPHMCSPSRSWPCGGTPDTPQRSRYRHACRGPAGEMFSALPQVSRLIRLIISGAARASSISRSTRTGAGRRGEDILRIEHLEFTRGLAVVQSGLDQGLPRPEQAECGHRGHPPRHLASRRAMKTDG